MGISGVSLVVSDPKEDKTVTRYSKNNVENTRINIEYVDSFNDTIPIDDKLDGYLKDYPNNM